MKNKAELPKFDITVTHRDPRSGRITHKTPYILHIVDGQRFWEKPAGSGNCFNGHGAPIGRWIREEKIVKGKKTVQGEFVEGAAHIEWTPPVTQDQQVAKENAALKAELAALKAESVKKIQPAQKKDQGA